MTGLSKKIFSMKVCVCAYFDLTIEINLVKVKQYEEIWKYEQKQIVESKLICAFMAISICFNANFRLFLCLPRHICMETTLR